jgi:hypothetical protein
VFKARHVLRRLSVMVDDDLLATTEDWCPEELLTGLLTCEDIDAFRYSDNGPPAGTRDVVLRGASEPQPVG